MAFNILAKMCLETKCMPDNKHVYPATIRQSKSPILTRDTQCTDGIGHRESNLSIITQYPHINLS